jgi:hypothetical protein
LVSPLFRRHSFEYLLEVLHDFQSMTPLLLQSVSLRSCAKMHRRDEGAEPHLLFGLQRLTVGNGAVANVTESVFHRAKPVL